MFQTKTELHTHLMGMLTVEEIIEFAKEIGIEEVCDINNPDMSISVDVLMSNNYYDKLCVPKDIQVPYSCLNDFYINRNLIFKDIVQQVRKDKNCTSREASMLVYNKWINKALARFVSQGVEYVEISYSIPEVFKDFILDNNLKGLIDCNFLLSTQRSNLVTSADTSANTFEKSAKKLKKLLDNDMAVGFDIMGEETPFSAEELDYSNYEKSFKRKLEVLFEELLKFDNTTLRIHSGENRDSFFNTNFALEVIDEIVNDKGYQIPPPEIRIGHGLYFENNDRYFELLKKYECIIEVNASSNYALSNISSYRDIPYSVYLDRGIPVVVSTDGAGVYNTDVKNENIIALNTIGKIDYNKILLDDDLIVSKKGRR